MGKIKYIKLCENIIPPSDLWHQRKISSPEQLFHWWIMLNWAPAPSLCSWKSVRASHQCCGGRAEAKSNLCTDSVCILSPVELANSLRPLRARGLEPVIPSSSKASSLRPVPCSRPHHQSPAVLLKKHSLSTSPLKSSQDKHSPARTGSAQSWAAGSKGGFGWPVLA